MEKQNKTLHLIARIVCSLLLAGLFAIIAVVIRAATGFSGQGFDGIAAVLGALMIGGAIGLIGGFLITKRLTIKQLIVISGLVMIVLVIVGMYGKLKKEKENHVIQKPKANIELKEKRQTTELAAAENQLSPEVSSEMLIDGFMGMAAIIFERNKTIPFYMHQKRNKEFLFVAQDSLIISQGGDGFSYAPPWFFPHYMKTDYQVTHLKVIIKTPNYCKVEVNKTNHRQAWLNLDDVKFLSWPDYILSMHSIELLDGETNNIPRLKPLLHAGIVISEQDAGHYLYQPIAVKDNWVKVKILTHNEQNKGMGWIKWRDNNKLVVKVNLFS